MTPKAVQAPSSSAALPNLLVDTVGLNYRYASAWNEVNARIAQRQHAVTIYVTLMTAILTVMIASARSASPIDPNIFSLLIPVISFVFGALNHKHDKTIALLRHFLEVCERKGAGLDLPGYNSDSRFRAHADSARKFHDFSCGVLVVLFNALGLLIAVRAYPDVLRPTGWPIAVYVVGTLLSIALVAKASILPHRFPAPDAGT